MKWHTLNGYLTPILHYHRDRWLVIRSDERDRLPFRQPNYCLIYESLLSFNEDRKSLDNLLFLGVIYVPHFFPHFVDFPLKYPKLKSVWMFSTHVRYNVDYIQLPKTETMAFPFTTFPTEAPVPEKRRPKSASRCCAANERKKKEMCFQFSPGPCFSAVTRRPKCCFCGSQRNLSHFIFLSADGFLKFKVQEIKLHSQNTRQQTLSK